MWSESPIDRVLWHHVVAMMMDTPEELRKARLKQMTQICRYGKQGDFDRLYDLDLLDFRERYEALREVVDEENEAARKQSGRS